MRSATDNCTKSCFGFHLLVTWNSVIHLPCAFIVDDLNVLSSVFLVSKICISLKTRASCSNAFCLISLYASFLNFNYSCLQSDSVTVIGLNADIHKKAELVFCWILSSGRSSISILVDLSGSSTGNSDLGNAFFLFISREREFRSCDAKSLSTFQILPTGVSCGWLIFGVYFRK